MPEKKRESKKISYNTIKNNTKLTSFSDIKEYVVKNAISKPLPELKQKKTRQRNAMLSEF